MRACKTIGSGSNGGMVEDNVFLSGDAVIYKGKPAEVITSNDVVSIIRVSQVEVQQVATEEIEKMESIAGKKQNASYPYGVFKVGDRCNVRRWTDVDPATVVHVCRKGCEVHVRIDKYALAEGQKPDISVGGFAGHCSNQRELKYDISESTGGKIEVYTLRIWRGRYVWTAKNGAPDGFQYIRQGWSAFYDYNF